MVHHRGRHREGVRHMLVVHHMREEEHCKLVVGSETLAPRCHQQVVGPSCSKNCNRNSWL